MDIKKTWATNKSFRYSVLIMLILTLIFAISQALFTKPVKKQTKTDKKDMQTNFLLDDSQMNKLSGQEAKAVYADIVKQNRLDQQEAKQDREKAEKLQAETKAEMASLRQQLQAVTQQLADVQLGKANNGNRSLDSRNPRNSQPDTTAPGNAPYQLNRNAPVNGEFAANGVIQPQRMNPMRTITQSSIKTSGNNGIIEVTSVSEQMIKEGKEVFAPSATPASNRTVKGDGTTPIDSKARHAARKDEMFLPATSIITGVLVTGLEAPTSISSKSEPMPVTMRIKKDVILPNNFTMDLRDCNLLGSAVGDLASQRAYIRATSISCVNSKGKAFDVKLEAYAVSEFDGKNGIKGTLISRNGNAIAGSAVAGGLSALAGSLSPSRVSSLNIDPNSQAKYQTPNFDALGALAGSGAASGGLNRLVDYYTSIAEQQWPVVEISPGRPITFVVQSGATIPTNLVSR
ncbi:TrbI/VirB10 family protein [Photorhabdus heterorhabditis]|uniref:Conjugal transfer protein TraB n=1 Tax=Photorhabdus heterorhabditis TaxID=880156 RepID=A0A5B0WIY6_9GAMM|nr:TrbI/VirB10 family protein [Photorhabdus heterorhabditis]KAA1186418.1 conjugal transfer protein TraB [Photorhabdus heterorhabditis]KOY62814.1 conjugal transfer protein TraB [Photorhabdus heterorhabditis]MBS9441186.1 conjugal transfer protein TraB [Photorhabdus heterorhabditis]